MGSSNGLLYNVTWFEMIMGLIICVIVFFSVTLCDSIFYPCYGGSSLFPFYAIFIKCANNQINYNRLNRSFIRNFTFNLLRNIVKPTLYPLLFVGYIQPAKIWQMALFVYTCTFIF